MVFRTGKRLWIYTVTVITVTTLLFIYPTYRATNWKRSFSPVSIVKIAVCAQIRIWRISGLMNFLIIPRYLSSSPKQCNLCHSVTDLTLIPCDLKMFKRTAHSTSVLKSKHFLADESLLFSSYKYFPPSIQMKFSKHFLQPETSQNSS